MSDKDLDKAWTALQSVLPGPMRDGWLSSVMTSPLPLALLLVLASCACPSADTSVPLPPEDPHVLEVLWSLEDCNTVEDIRNRLAADLRPGELTREGFDQVTIAQCIDEVTEALLDARERPGDPSCKKRLTESVSAYAAARREARVRRTIGTESCLPRIR